MPDASLRVFAGGSSVVQFIIDLSRNHMGGNESHIHERSGNEKMVSSADRFLPETLGSRNCPMKATTTKSVSQCSRYENAPKEKTCA